MSTPALFHRIYTHASSTWQPGGGRFERVEHDAKDVLPDSALRELDDLLVKLEPEAASPAFALRCLSGERESYACVVVAYRGFDDEQGRNGMLTHARVVRLDRDEPWLNPLPLLDEARAFPIDEVLQAPPAERLRAYLDHLAPARRPPAAARPTFAGAPNDVLHDVLVALLATLGTRGATRIQIPNASLESVALAAASLPPGLQRRASWAYDAVNTAPVDVIWSALSGVPAAKVGTPVVQQCVSSYVKLLLDSSFNPEPLMNEDGMRDATDLQRFLQKAAIAGPAGERVMSTKSKHKPKADPPRNDELLESLDRQHQAVYQSLRKYIDQRLAAHEAAQPESGLSPAARRPQSASTLWIPVAATAILTALLILGGQWLLKKPGPEVPQQPQYQAPITTETEQPIEQPAQPSPQRVTVQKLIAAAERDGKWAEAVAALSEQEPTILLAIIDRAVQSQDVTNKVHDQFADYARRLRGAGKPIDSDARAALRPLLFEYVVKSEDDLQTVDGSLAGINSALLKKAKERWGVKSAANDINDRHLHSEMILRWLEGNLP